MYGSVNPIPSYDTTLSIQSNEVSLAYQQLQANQPNATPLNIQFSNNVSYSTGNLTSTDYSAIYSSNTQLSNSNFIPLALFNPSNYNQTATFITTQQPYTQISAMPNFQSHSILNTSMGQIKPDYSFSNSCRPKKPFSCNLSKHNTFSTGLYPNTHDSSLSPSSTYSTQTNPTNNPNPKHLFMSGKRLLPDKPMQPVFAALNSVANITLHAPNTPILNINGNNMGLKRRKSRFKKPIEQRNVLPKNPLMLLHEFRPNVEYRFVSQSGPIHRPIFTMSVNIEDHTFKGSGRTKKEARLLAADNALKFLIENPEYIKKKEKVNTNTTEMDKNDETSSDEDEEPESKQIKIDDDHQDCNQSDNVSDINTDIDKKT